MEIDEDLKFEINADGQFIRITPIGKMHANSNQSIKHSLSTSNKS